MINLKSDKVIDKHLKPIKSGEDNTSLELASEDNGAKVKGNLDITGNINVGGKLVTTGGGSSSATGIGSPDVDIESSNDIRLSSLNGAITFYKGNTVINEMQGMASGYNLKMYPEDYSGSGTDDFASLDVGTNGALTIGTTSLSDADINLACNTGQIVSNSKHIFNHDIILDDADKLRLDGDMSGNTYIHEASADKVEIVVGADEMLTLDEANQRVTIEADKLVYKIGSGGDEFSPTDSAYAGMILGHTYIAPAIADRWLFTTSWESVTSNGAASYAPKVTFVFPPSGNVMITCALGSNCTGLSGNLYMGLATDASATTLHSRYEHIVLDVDETDTVNPRHSWMITGTPGDAEEIWIMCKVASGTGRINFGGASGAIQVWATALPVTIYDGT